MRLQRLPAVSKVPFEGSQEGLLVAQSDLLVAQLQLVTLSGHK